MRERQREREREDDENETVILSIKFEKRTRNLMWAQKRTKERENCVSCEKRDGRSYTVVQTSQPARRKY